MMTIKADLEKVYALLEDEDCWTQRELAYDAQGNTIGPNSPEATCWCLAGAFYKALSITYRYPYLYACASWLYLAEHVRIITGDPHAFPDEFNDRATHEEVLALLQGAIAVCKK